MLRFMPRQWNIPVSISGVFFVCKCKIRVELIIPRRYDIYVPSLHTLHTMQVCCCVVHLSSPLAGNKGSANASLCLNPSVPSFVFLCSFSLFLFSFLFFVSVYVYQEQGNDRKDARDSCVCERESVRVCTGTWAFETHKVVRFLKKKVVGFRATFFFFFLQEGGGEIAMHSRNVQGSMRRKDDRRKRERESRK